MIISVLIRLDRRVFQYIPVCPGVCDLVLRYALYDSAEQPVLRALGRDETIGDFRLSGSVRGIDVLESSADEVLMYGIIYSDIGIGIALIPKIRPHVVFAAFPECAYDTKRIYPGWIPVHENIIEVDIPGVFVSGVTVSGVII